MKLSSRPPSTAKAFDGFTFMEPPSPPTSTNTLPSFDISRTTTTTSTKSSIHNISTSSITSSSPSPNSFTFSTSAPVITTPIISSPPIVLPPTPQSIHSSPSIVPPATPHPSATKSISQEKPLFAENIVYAPPGWKTPVGAIVRPCAGNTPTQSTSSFFSFFIILLTL